MPRRSKPKPDNPEQFKRFIEMARETGADATEEEFERAFRRVAVSSRNRATQSRRPAPKRIPRTDRNDDPA
jgi:hypothetical protein